jgi:hypothetical protein
MINKRVVLTEAPGTFSSLEVVTVTNHTRKHSPLDQQGHDWRNPVDCIYKHPLPQAENGSARKAESIAGKGV